MSKRRTNSIYFCIYTTVILSLITEICTENALETDIMSTLVSDHLLRGSNNNKPVITHDDIEEIKKSIEEGKRDLENAENYTETLDKEFSGDAAEISEDKTEITTAVIDKIAHINYTEEPKLKDVGDELDSTTQDITEHVLREDKGTQTVNDELFDSNGDSATDATQNLDETKITTEVNKANELFDKTFEENQSNIIESTTKDNKVDMTTVPYKKPLIEPQIITSNVPELEEHLENSGNRSPKVDDSDQLQIQDKRTFDSHEQIPGLSKSATLKSWIDDTWLRSPPALLVPLRPLALTRALAVWEDLTKNEQLGLTDIVVIGYDSNGVNWRSRHNLLETSSNVNGKRSVTDVLHKLLHKYKDIYSSDRAVDATMRALTTSAKLVPYDSALFIISDKGASDPERLPLALKALVEKRLKVYTIWTDPRFPLEASAKELEDLQNVSSHTEGSVLPYILEDLKPETRTEVTQITNLPPPEPIQEERSGRLNTLFDDKMEIIFVQRSSGGAMSVGIPVESGVTALRIFVEGALDHAVLYPPNEAPQIDLYNKTSVREFSPSSRTDNLTPRDVYLVFPGAPDGDMLSVLPMATENAEGLTQNSGTWHLSAKCDSCDYRITVSAHAWIRFEAGLVNDDTLSLRVTGPVSTVRDSTLVDEYGNELDKIPFSYHQTPTIGEFQKEESEIQDLKRDVPFTKGHNSASIIYAKIVGRDFRGEPYVRLAGPLNPQREVRAGRSASLRFPDSDVELSEELSQRALDNRWGFNESTVLPNNRATSQIVNQRGTLLTAVQIGLGTRLYGAPGDNLQLHFEVTNFREQAISFRFEAVGELRFLRGITPASQVVAAGQTVNVIVQVGITITAQPGARDLITFTAYGLEQVSISTYVYVLNPEMSIIDVWAPTLTNNFQGSCIGKTGDDCSQHIWSSRIIAQDAVAGLLRLTSMPVGITYDSNFIAGTREQVLATYRATCCSPRVAVTAVDAMGNANSYILDISSYVTPAGVAAIVLGVFLAIALIILLVFLAYWLVRRRRESKELSYTASSRRDIS